MTTGNTVIDNVAIGISMSDATWGMSSYVATVPEPAAALPLVGLAILGGSAMASPSLTRIGCPAPSPPACGA